MSRVLGIGTTEFLSRYTDNGGTTLRADDRGRCAFLTESGGCRVHAQRPLVCRLYPLGRSTDERGREAFAVFPNEIQCEAVTENEGTVESFLRSQGVEPYFEWARLYGKLYRRMVGLLERIEAKESLDTPMDDKASFGQASDSDTGVNAACLSFWQDIDAMVAEYCSAKGIRAPEGVAESISLHIRAMEEWLDDLESKQI
jgi:hypothetical protein